MPRARRTTLLSPPPESGGIWDRGDWAALVAVMLLGALLRVPTLGQWSIWQDEAFTIHDAVALVDPPPGAVTAYGRYPLNYLIEGYAMRWWGRGAVAVRVLPCLAGVLCIGALYAGVRWQAGRWCAFLASTLLALSAWHIYWSQNARHYALMLLLTVVAMYAGFRAVSTRRVRWGVLALAAFVLATLAHPTAVILAGSFGVFLVWRYAGGVRQLSPRGRVILGGVVGVCGAVLAIRFYPILQESLVFRPGGNLPYFAGSLAQYLEIPLVIAAVGGLLPAWHANRAWGVFLGTYVAVPLVGLGVLGLFLKLGAAYAIVVLPGLCALAAHAVVGFARAPFGSLGAGVVMLALVAGHELGESFLYLRYRHGDRPRWREAAAYLETHEVDHADVFTTGGPALAYHLGYPPLSFREPTPLTWLNPARRAAVFAHPRPAWLVVKNDRLSVVDPDGQLRAWLAEHAVIAATFPAWTSVKDRTIYIYRTHAAPAPAAGLAADSHPGDA